MLKVLINEEEVLTNKDFTIKKEMLNTPSVILNNVYPKSWEDEKDYTSNFYHPQDYSKCKIIDENIIPAEPGETITGTSFTILDNDNTKLNELTEIEGNTSQKTTTGKNLLPTSDIISASGTVSNGITFTLNSDGSIKANGTATGAISIYINADYTELSAGIYTFSDSVSSGESGTTYFLYADVKHTDGSNWNTYNFSTANTTTGMTQTIPEGFKFKTRIVVRNGQTLNNVVFKPMLEVGSSATSYEPYTNGSSPNPTYPQPINVVSGLQEVVVCGKNFFNISTINENTFINEYGNTGTSSVSNLSDYIVVNANTNYKLSYDYTTLLNSGQRNICYYDNNKSFVSSIVYFPTDKSHTITIPNNIRYLRFSYDKNCTDIQLEKGNQATTYEEYIGQSYEINLGKNLFNKNGNITLDYRLATDGYNYPDNGYYISPYINVEPNTTYTKNSPTADWAHRVCFYSSNSMSTFISRSEDNTFTTPNNCQYLRFCGLQTELDTTQLEKGSQATDYVPYKTPIELCKINDYKDRMYKDSGKWYIEKKTNKIASYNGETITTDYISTTGELTTGATIYYVLATPTTEEITDSELISQLNAIELLEGLNNVSVSSADLPGEITIHYNYTEEQTIDDLLFCGVVKNSGNISLNPREPHFQSLQILDFKTFLSEGELDSFVIYQKTILEAIQMVIANIQDYGFILGNVNILNPTDIIGAYSTKDKTAYDVFNYIADITQSRWTTRLIDENHVAIDFYDPTLMIEGTPINYTQAFFENNLIDDMTYSYGSSNYRNKQVMTSSQVYSNISQQQSIVANGYQTQFPTEQPIGKINSITSNGIPLTFATFTEKEMGYVADFYYSPGENYFESEDLRTTGEILIIDYVAIVEGRQIITNPLEIDRISDSTGRKGIISRYEQRNDATTSTELQKIGESYIKYKGTPEIKLKISTRKNIWEVGQRVQFNAPIEELDTEYMVRTKKINYTATIDTIFYEYELISSFNSETEINYFDNQRAKASGNIGEGEYISRNIDIESTANIIFYDTETTEVQVDGDNVLNSILNSPFTS